MAEATFTSASFALSFKQQFRMQQRGLSKSHGGFFKRLRVMAATFLAIIWLPSLLPDAALAFYTWLSSRLGLACETVVDLVQISILIVFVAAMVVSLLRLRREQSRRVGHTVNWTITAEGDGLRYASRNLEHLLRWPGVHQVFVEREGIIIVHGNSSFFVPEAAFDGQHERRSFMKLIVDNISPEARALSGPALHA